MDFQTGSEDRQRRRFGKWTENFNGRRNPLGNNGVKDHPPYKWYRNGIETVRFWRNVPERGTRDADNEITDDRITDIETQCHG